MKQFNLKNPLHFFATGFGTGLIQPASGTWGTLVGLFMAILLWQLTHSSFFFLLLATVGFFFGIYICAKVSRDLNVHDDSRIVWDEIIAIFLMFAFLPEYDLLSYILAFVTFRLFDILKPYPIHYLDKKLETGLGIMVDDILAAIYALVTLHIIYFVL